MENLLSETPYKFKKSYGGTPEPQTPQDAPWLRGPSLKILNLGCYRRLACRLAIVYTAVTHRSTVARAWLTSNRLKVLPVWSCRSLSLLYDYVEADECAGRSPSPGASLRHYWCGRAARVLRDRRRPCRPTSRAVHAQPWLGLHHTRTQHYPGAHRHSNSHRVSSCEGRAVGLL